MGISMTGCRYPVVWFGFWFPGFFMFHNFTTVVTVRSFDGHHFRRGIVSDRFFDPRVREIRSCGPCLQVASRHDQAGNQDHVLGKGKIQTGASPERFQGAGRHSLAGEWGHSPAGEAAARSDARMERLTGPSMLHPQDLCALVLPRRNGLSAVRLRSLPAARYALCLRGALADMAASAAAMALRRASEEEEAR